MEFKNAQLYNVCEILEDKDGYLMSRVPNAVRMTLNEKAQQMAFNCCGVEIRFKHIGKKVTVVLQTINKEAQSMAIINYGSLQANWEITSKVISHEPTKIVIDSIPSIDKLEKITNKYNLPFDPHIVRILLPYSAIKLIDIIGECEPPTIDQIPQKRYLAYGSSITHGGSSILAPLSYAARISQALSVDLINLGFAGSAFMEGTMADYIASRNDWDFATLELGINIADALTEAEFYKRAKYFVKTIADKHPDKFIFCIDAFTHYKDLEVNTSFLRKIINRVIQEIDSPKVKYINGLNILKNASGLSADLIHPSIGGMAEIAENLLKVIRMELML